MENYKVTVREASKELTAKERIMIKDTSNALRLDNSINPGETLVINPMYYAVLDVHNDKSENKDYTVLVIVDTDGKKYSTGSPSFLNAYKDIAEEMEGAEESWSIEVYKMESKNYTGRHFLTCSIV